MEIIEQPWEKKNLGVRCAEFRFESTDTVEMLKSNGMDSFGMYDYQLARVPAGRMDLAYWLEENGFRFAEAGIEIEAPLGQLSLPEIYKRADEWLGEHRAAEDELEDVYEKIRGGIFDTDKIALDPKFGIRQSGIRFANWCRQEVEAGNARVYLVEHSGRPIGFYAIKDESRTTAYSLLAGLFDQEKYMGLGYSVLFCPMRRAKMEGKKKIFTKVSSNNPASLKMHLYLGYAIKKLDYVYARHAEKGKGGGTYCTGGQPPVPEK